MQHGAMQSTLYQMMEMDPVLKIMSISEQVIPNTIFIQIILHKFFLFSTSNTWFVPEAQLGQDTYQSGSSTCESSFLY